MKKRWSHYWCKEGEDDLWPIQDDKQSISTAKFKWSEKFKIEVTLLDVTSNRRLPAPIIRIPKKISITSMTRKSVWKMRASQFQGWRTTRTKRIKVTTELLWQREGKDEQKFTCLSWAYLWIQERERLRQATHTSISRCLCSSRNREISIDIKFHMTIDILWFNYRFENFFKVTLWDLLRRFLEMS